MSRETLNSKKGLTIKEKGFTALHFIENVRLNAGSYYLNSFSSIRQSYAFFVHHGQLNQNKTKAGMT